MRRFDPSRPRLHRSSERSSGMPEQLRLEQRLRNRRAVQDRKRLVRPQAKPMDRLRDHFLARTGLAFDQHRCRSRCHQPHHFSQDSPMHALLPTSSARPVLRRLGWRFGATTFRGVLHQRTSTTGADSRRRHRGSRPDGRIVLRQVNPAPRAEHEAVRSCADFDRRRSPPLHPSAAGRSTDTSASLAPPPRRHRGPAASYRASTPPPAAPPAAQSSPPRRSPRGPASEGSANSTRRRARNAASVLTRITVLTAGSLCIHNSSVSAVHCCLPVFQLPAIMFAGLSE